MEDYMYGRYTTLTKLKAVRDDVTKHTFARLRAARNMDKILEQMRDRKLMGMRERLIKATRAEDLHAVYKIENEILAYEGRERETME